MRPTTNRNTAAKTKRLYRRWIRAQVKWARAEGFQGLEISQDRSGRTTIEYGGQHDEGWSWSCGVHDPRSMTATYDTDGTDCDGRLSTSDEVRVVGVHRRRDGGLCIDTERIAAGQRDYAAERMGY